MSLELLTRVELANRLGYGRKQLDNIFDKIRVKPIKIITTESGRKGLYSLAEVKCEIEKRNSRPKSNRKEALERKISREYYDRSIFATRAELCKLLNCSKDSLKGHMSRRNIKPVRRLLECDSRVAIYDIEQVRNAIANEKPVQRIAKILDSTRFHRLPLREKVCELRRKGFKVLAISKQLKEPVDIIHRIVEIHDKTEKEKEGC